MKVQKRSKKQNEKGVALVIALVVLFLLTALAAGLIFATQSEMWATANYQQLTQSRYAAEAGAQMARNWFENSYSSPSSLTAFNTTVTPVQCATGSTVCTANSPIILGGSSHNFPIASDVTSFSTALTTQPVAGVANATYSVTAELLQIPSPVRQTWQITSTGSVAGVKNAKTQVVETVQYSMTPTFSYGLFATGTGCGTISMSGSALVDSYNSSSGAYTPAPATGNRTNNGNIGTDGNVSLSGSATIDGSLYGPNANTGGCGGGSVTALSSSSTTGSGDGVSGSVSQLSKPPVYPTPAFVSPFTYSTGTSCCSTYGSSATIPLSPSTTGTTYSQISTSGSQNVAFAAGNYTIGDINLSGNSMVLNAGTYNINSLKMSGGSLVINSGPVIINVNPATSSNPFSLSGSGIANNTGVPANLEITYGGTGTIQLSGSSSCAAVVYAPNAAIQTSGSAPWFGAIIGNTISPSGSAAIHFDTALLTSFPLTPPTWNMIAFTWAKN